MISGPASFFRLHAIKAKLVQIQLIDKHVNDPNRIILSDVIVQMLGEQCALRTIFAFDKSLHQAPLLLRCSKLPKLLAFSHGLGRQATHAAEPGFCRLSDG